jgi:hypothetical protein
MIPLVEAAPVVAIPALPAARCADSLSAAIGSVVSADQGLLCRLQPLFVQTYHSMAHPDMKGACSVIPHAGRDGIVSWNTRMAVKVDRMGSRKRHTYNVYAGSKKRTDGPSMA